MYKCPVRQRLIGSRAKPSVAYRKVLRQLADDAHLLRAIALHQLIGIFRMPGIGRHVIHEKSLHLRPGPACWSQNLKRNLLEFLVRVMIRCEERSWSFRAFGDE